ncbi:MAG: trigger factor [Acholeplasmataceae bacterium]|jgi:trigger factor|nr:trigger factor [Acholeplasmataceae bacterium]
MKFEKLGTNYAKFTFEITPKVFAEGLDYAFDKVKKDIEVKGFRKGHVPRNVYENRFGVESLYEEALNYVIAQNYQKVFEESTVIIVGEPKIDVDIKKITLEKPFEVSLTFPVKPDVKLGAYVGAEVEKKDLTVSEEEIEQEIQMLLSRNSQLVLKEAGALENGDTAIIDFEGFVDGEAFAGGKAENHQLKIGSNQFIPGFEEKLVGMNTGEEKEIKVEFPKDYHEKSLAGQEAVFKVKLHEIKQEVKEQLTDEFVKSLKRDKIETVDQLKTDIEENLAAQKTTSEKNRIVGAAVKFAVDNANVDIPFEMIEQEQKNIRSSIEQQAKQYGIEFEMYVQFSGMTMEQFEAEIGRQAQERVLTSLVIDAIAEKEALPVAEEEIKDKYEEIAKLYNMDLKEVKKQLTEEVIIKEVRFSKTIDFLEENIKEIDQE